MAGVTTFLTMSYIIFVQPAILSACGMDFGAVMMATCIASALSTFLMAFWANYPIALAPAMGHNIYFAYTVCLGMGYPWQVALGATAISGAIFLLLASFGFREKVIDAVPESLRSAIGVGIGLLIALVGLEWAGLVVASPGTLIGLGNLKNTPVLLTLTGLLITSILLARKVKGAILWGILATTLLGLPLGLVKFQGVLGTPPSIMPTLFQFRIADIFIHRGFVGVVFVLLFLDLFDSVGTLFVVAQEGGFMRKGKLPRVREALQTGAVATMIGAATGTSTVSSYVESAAGIAIGGRTGLTGIVTGLLLLASIFFFPLVRMIGGGLDMGQGLRLYPVIAPTLIIIGAFIIKSVRNIPWDDFSEAIPAFLTIIMMPVTFSITEGIAFGFTTYCLLKLVTGRGRDVDWKLYFLSALFLLRYALL